jgi:DNA polymerase-3 subunit beta
VASEQTHRIRLKLEGNRMELNVLTPDLGEAHDEIEVGYSGEPFIIGFNANYLIEVLRYIETEEVKIGFEAPERAATIEPVASGDGVAMDYLCLVMPLRLVD